MKEIENKIFDKWTALTRHEIGKNRFYNCICKCGTYAVVDKYNLLSGRSKGCIMCRPKNIKHGLSRTNKLYSTWKSMKVRCLNPNNRSYKYYGGRGIKVCDRWLESFENFIEDIGTKPTPNHSLDRIDNDKGYCPENCRWATPTEQANNQRTNLKIFYKGKNYTEAELSRLTGIKRTTLQRRRGANFVGNELVEGKVDKRPIYNGLRYSIKDLALMHNIKPLTLAYRLRVGYPVEDALVYKRGKI